MEGSDFLTVDFSQMGEDCHLDSKIMEQWMCLRTLHADHNGHIKLGIGTRTSTYILQPSSKPEMSKTPAGPKIFALL